MPKITPFLWFENEALDAAHFYVSIFPNSEIRSTMQNEDGSTLLTAFVIDGSEVTALNGGPHFKLTPAFTFVIHCASQAEIDHYWDNLVQGGEAMQCGWLTDKFGLSWQVVPDRFIELVNSGTAGQRAATMEAMMQMTKFDISKLEEAHNSSSG